MRHSGPDERAGDREVHIHQGSGCKSGECVLKGVYSDDEAAGLARLEKNFDARHPHGLLTTKRAGQVTRLLRT